MDKDTLKTKKWLDKRFAEGVEKGEYFAHQPIYGYKKGRTEGRDLIRYLRNLSILYKISHFSFSNFIDIGGAEGYMTNLVKTIFNVDAYTCDLSFEANLRAKELFGIKSATIDISNLPFKNEAFDIVLCSEVLEHVANPIQAIYELKRIAKKALIITTEAICYDELERRLKMSLVDLSEPHSDRNWFLVDDFIYILGNEVGYENTICNIKSADKKEASFEEVKRILMDYEENHIFTREGIGITVLLSKIQKNDKPLVSKKDLVSIMLELKVDTDYRKDRQEKLTGLDSELIKFLQCPKCSGALNMNSHTVQCVSCNRKYDIRDGVPLIYTKEEDSDDLSKKWNDIYMKEFYHQRKELVKLIRVFKHTKKKANFLTRMIVSRILKLQKFIYNFKEATKSKNVKHVFLYLLNSAKRRISREISRIMHRIKKPK